MKKLLILNGSALNYAGNSPVTSPTVEQIELACQTQCSALNINLDFRQADNEKQMIGWLAQDNKQFDGLIINPTGWSKSTRKEFEVLSAANNTATHFKNVIIEVHINNIFDQRSEQTQPLQNPTGKMGLICGLGVHGYLLAINTIKHQLEAQD